MKHNKFSWLMADCRETLRGPGGAGDVPGERALGGRARQGGGAS